MTHTSPNLAVTTLKDHDDLTYQTCALHGVRFAMAMLRNKSDAEEAVQETFCRLHVAGPVEGDSNFRGRFFVTLRNHCIDLIRKRKIRKEVVMQALVENATNGGAATDTDEIFRAVDNAINQLPEKWRQVLQLRIHGELSYDEIAKVAGITRNQVRTWIYRGRRQLETELTNQGIMKNNTGGE